MPISPSPEPWKGPTATNAKKYDKGQNRASFYDANRKLVGFVIVREAEKDGWRKKWRYGAMQRRDRIITCVNACQRIPSEFLRDDGLLGMAIQLMRRACDFGDVHLQTLPDRIAVNMTQLYYGQILRPEKDDQDAEWKRLFDEP